MAMAADIILSKNGASLIMRANMADAAKMRLGADGKSVELVTQGRDGKEKIDITQNQASVTQFKEALAQLNEKGGFGKHFFSGGDKGFREKTFSEIASQIQQEADGTATGYSDNKPRGGFSNKVTLSRGNRTLEVPLFSDELKFTEQGTSTCAQDPKLSQDVKALIGETQGLRGILNLDASKNDALDKAFHAGNIGVKYNSNKKPCR
jgi:hypothetical protein